MARDRVNRLEVIPPPVARRPRLAPGSQKEVRAAVASVANPRRVVNSSYLERLAEHAFIADIMREGYDMRAQTVEVLRAEVDADGYDLAMEANGILRHIQLKSIYENAKTAKQSIHAKLGQKPSGCVIIQQWCYDYQAQRHYFAHHFFGNGPGVRLPSLADYPRARSTRYNAAGEKPDRLNHHVVPHTAFRGARDISDLYTILFGES